MKREDVHVDRRRSAERARRGRSPSRACDSNIDVGIQYLESWLRGNGCVPIYNLMEDAATAEISRTQVWQWMRHGARLSDGRSVTRDLVKQVIGEERDKLKQRYGAGKFDQASQLFDRMMTGGEFPDFMTLGAYASLD